MHPPNQPVYVASGARAPASAEMGKTGCGTIGSITGTSAPLSAWGGFLFFVAFAVPISVWMVLRRRQSEENRRKFPRFVMNSAIQLGGRPRARWSNANDLRRWIVVQCRLDARKGGIVTMMITSPDGKEQVQVQGQIVWNEKNETYGVQFEQGQRGSSCFHPKLDESAPEGSLK